MFNWTRRGKLHSVSLFEPIRVKLIICVVSEDADHMLHVDDNQWLFNESKTTFFKFYSVELKTSE